MRTALKIWLALTCISWGLYTPYYLFSNNALDAVEELTLWEYAPATSQAQSGYSYEQIRRVFEQQGLDIDLEFEDALDDNDLLSDVDIEYVDSAEASRIRAASGVRLVQATAETQRGERLTLVFVVRDKAYLSQPKAIVLGLVHATLASSEFTADLTKDIGTETYFVMLFHKDEAIREEAVFEMQKTYSAAYAEYLLNPSNALKEPKQEPADTSGMTIGEAFGMPPMEPVVADANTPKTPEPMGSDFSGEDALKAAMTKLVGAVQAETGAGEYVDARTIFTGPIIGTTSQDAAVLYTMEREIATRYLAIFEYTSGDYRLVANRIVDNGSYEVAIENRLIAVKTLTHSTEDPMCCPSQEMSFRYRIEGDRLVDVPRG